MAEKGILRNQGAGVKDRLFYAVSSDFVVLGDVRPNVEEVRFGKRGEDKGVHCLAVRQSSFIA